VDSDTVFAFARPLRCNCGASLVSAPSPGPAPADDDGQYPPDAYERPATDEDQALAVIVLLNLDNATSVDVNLAAGLSRASFGDDLVRLTSGSLALATLLDSINVAEHAGSVANATHVRVEPWQAVVLAMRLFPRST
jgi:hypothetical protein